MQAVPAIDAVITWVDGSDPVHRRKRLQAMGDVTVTTPHKVIGTESTRFNADDEIYFCIASILKYAPFIRKIYVITDNQRPDLLSDFETEAICDQGKIEIVDHEQIFSGFEAGLPTFNSLTIETMLCNIAGLSDYFLYLNDDFFLNSAVKHTDFVTVSGGPILRGKTTPHPKNKSTSVWSTMLSRLGMPPKRDIFAVSQSNAAKLVGLENYLKVAHLPHVVRTETLRQYLAANSDVLLRQISHKFRSFDQFWPIGIANHIEIANRNAEVLPIEKSVYIKPNTINDARLGEITAGNARFGCVQSLDQLTPEWRSKLQHTMRKKFETHLPSALRVDTVKE